jgi:formylglycine-generating enzyme required for sulfatase activity
MAIKKIKRTVLMVLLTITILPIGAGDMARGTDAPAPPSGGTPRQPDAPSGMVLVPAGKFIMGCLRKQRFCDKDEFPSHEVYLDGYFIDAYEVTNEDYTRCVAAGACQKPLPREGFDGPKQPVGGVSWFMATAYCSFVGKRLPAEAEWEKAARGADGRTYPWGNQAPNCDLAVFYYKKEDGCGTGATWPVGSKPAGKSPYGAYDMAGNVWEWVNDWYSVDYYKWGPDNNPKGPELGQYRVFRGGSWENMFFYTRSTFRVKMPPDFRHNHIGFRCARNL